MQREIRIAVALIVRENGDTLLVRKRGMPMYMQAGGGIAGGEAADAPDHLLIAYVFLIKLHNEDIAPTGGIDEAVWTPIDKAPALPLAPLTRNHILTLFWQMQFGADLSYQPEKAVFQASHARN